MSLISQEPRAKSQELNVMPSLSKQENQPPKANSQKPKAQYSHIFFDLDHTLWDFERNAEETLVEIYEEAHLSQLGIPQASDFVRGFMAVNNHLWHLFDTRQITQTELRTSRFKKALEHIGITIEDKLSDELNELFLATLPNKGHLLEGSMETLDYLVERYPLHLITNGFNDVQTRKIQSSGIEHYFQEVITNEKAQARKPERKIFDYALQCVRASASDCIMIGDNYEVDIIGASDAGLDTVFYNPERKPNQVANFEIQNLVELKLLL